MMKYLAAKLSLTLLILSLFGCGAEPTIDGASEQSFNTSLAQMEADLTAEKKESFREAILIIAAKNVDFSTLADDPVSEASTSSKRMRERLHGKTVDEAIEIAARTRHGR